MFSVTFLLFLLSISLSVPRVLGQDATGAHDDRTPEETAEEETIDPQVISVEEWNVDAVDLQLSERFGETSMKIRKLLRQAVSELLQRVAQRITDVFNLTPSEATAKLHQALQYNAEGKVVRYRWDNSTTISDNWKILDVPPISRFISNAQKRVTALKTWAEFCLVKYQEKCFWIEFRHGVGMTCGEARHICESNGGRLAYVYSPEHLDVLQLYLRTLIVRLNQLKNPSVYSWIGFRYSSEIRTVFADGSPAPYSIWEPVEHNQCAVVRTTLRWSYEGQGFDTRGHTDTAESVICEVVL